MALAKGRRPSAADHRVGNRESADLDELFEAPPERFVAARDKLVAKLNASGRRDAASKIKPLARPTLAVWTINQLARHEPEKVASLLEAGEQLRDAQGRALGARQGAVEDLKTAAHSERQALGNLLRAAPGALASAGRAASSALLGRIESTLHAIAAGKGPEREALRHGHLSREVQMVGFPGAIGQSSAPSTRSPREGKGSARSATMRELQSARTEELTARHAARALATFLRQAERKAKRLRARAERAQGAAIKAQSEALAAEQAAAAAQQKLTAAQQQAERASARLAVTRANG
jgi:hypothetical protein